jgi:CheY-like chemotaxis protein
MRRYALIVDDSKLARMSAIRALSSLNEGWEVVEAADADAAIDHAKLANFDVALIDFNMPGRDGLALAGELRILNAKMGLILVSANAQLEVIARCEALGAAFVAKPFKTETLAAALPFRPPG